MSLRLGVMAARQAISNYREQHKSGMLSETEIAFRALTAEKYSALRTQTDGNNEILLAMRESDKRSVAVSEMSKGTHPIFGKYYKNFDISDAQRVSFTWRGYWYCPRK